VIVPAYRNASLLSGCVDSLLANWDEIKGRDARLVLINDSPDDDEVGELLNRWQTRHDEVEVLVNPVNVGFVRSTNRALARCVATRRDALLVNADTLTFAGTLAELLRVTAQDERIGFASPRSNRAAFCSLPAWREGDARPVEKARDDWLRLSRTLPDWHFAPTAVGFFLFIAHRVLCDHGLLDESFGTGYEEENDLVMRARRHGWRAVVVNRAFAHHVGSASFGMQPPDELARQRHENQRRLFERYPSFQPMMRRFEASPSRRAERLLEALLPDPDGRLSVLFDLTELAGLEFGVALAATFSERWGSRFAVCASIGDSGPSARLRAQQPWLRIVDPETPGMHAAAVRLGAPHHSADLLRFESTAAACIYVVPDTGQEDLLPGPADEDVSTLLDHIAEQACGLVLPGARSGAQFFARRRRPRTDRVVELALPADAEDVTTEPPVQVTGCLLVAGDIDDDTGVLSTVAADLRARFIRRTLRCIEAHDDPAEPIAAAVKQASVVVIVGRHGGLGRWLATALRARRPVVARSAAPLRDLAESIGCAEHVIWVEIDSDWPDAVERALAQPSSGNTLAPGTSFAVWADRLAVMVIASLEEERLYRRISERLEAGDTLQTRALSYGRQGAVDEQVRIDALLARPITLDALLALDDREFIEHAYVTLLKRPADASGLRDYLAQLKRGANRLLLLRSLRESPEGRACAAQLTGLDERIVRQNGPGRVLRRWFGR
jgi:GT2 family glycosyltransferase